MTQLILSTGAETFACDVAEALNQLANILWMLIYWLLRSLIEWQTKNLKKKSCLGKSKYEILWRR